MSDAHLCYTCGADLRREPHKPSCDVWGKRRKLTTIENPTHGDVITLKVQRRKMLVTLFPCANCGVKATEECLPEYGCIDSDRHHPNIERPTDPAKDQLDALG